MEYSVFVPSIPSRLNNLKAIIDGYLNGVVVPEEIVINVSSVNKKEDIDFLTSLGDEYLDDPVHIYMQPNLLCAGPNRQMAKEYTSGDVIIYQDDDDYPSEERVSVIKHFFENYDIVCLNHGYVKNRKYVDVDINSLDVVMSDTLYKAYFPNGELKECVSHETAYGGVTNHAICAGPVSIRREVLKTITWRPRKNLMLSKRNGEDYDFCMETLYHFNKSMIIDAKIYSIR